MEGLGATWSRLYFFLHTHSHLKPSIFENGCYLPLNIISSTEQSLCYTKYLKGRTKYEYPLFWLPSILNTLLYVAVLRLRRIPNKM